MTDSEVNVQKTRTPISEGKLYQVELDSAATIYSGEFFRITFVDYVEMPIIAAIFIL